MFTSPRVLVVDDKPAHLSVIAAAIQSLGSACAQVHFTPERDVPFELFRTARLIFMDLQLMSDSAGSDFNQHYAQIQRILSNSITKTNGPYVLVVWTDVPNRVAELEDYLERNLYESKPHVRPAALITMSKHDFLDPSGAETLDGSIRTRIEEDLGKVPAMQALIEWETELLASASHVLADVLELTSSGSDSLPDLLYRLADAAAGKANAPKDPRGSLLQAFLPLVLDHMQNMDYDKTRWGKAFNVPKADLTKLSPARASVLNTRLHIAPHAESHEVHSTEWGAISELEPGFVWKELGLDDEAAYVETVLEKDLQGNLTDEEQKAVRVVQVRLGAACDYAQRADGPIPLALAALVPSRQEKTRSLKPNNHSWISPDLVIAGKSVQIFVNPRFVRVRGTDEVGTFTPVARVREQLLVALIEAVGHHAVRPGIVTFSA